MDSVELVCLVVQFGHCFCCAGALHHAVDTAVASNEFFIAHDYFSVSLSHRLMVWSARVPTVS